MLSFFPFMNTFSSVHCIQRHKSNIWYLMLAKLSGREAFCTIIVVRLCRRPDPVSSARDEEETLLSLAQSASPCDHFYLFAYVRLQLVLSDCEKSLQCTSYMLPLLNLNTFQMPVNAGCIGLKVFGQKRPIDLKEISNLSPFQELMWLSNQRVLGEKC